MDVICDVCKKGQLYDVIRIKIRGIIFNKKIILCRDCFYKHICNYCKRFTKTGICKECN